MNSDEPTTICHHDSGLQWLILRDERDRYFTNFGDSREGDTSDLVSSVNTEVLPNQGHRDWRLPTIEELETLIGRHDSPATGWYWSSSPCEDSINCAWGIRFRDGTVDADWLEVKHKVRLVRSLT